MHILPLVETQITLVVMLISNTDPDGGLQLELGSRTSHETTDVLDVISAGQIRSGPFSVEER